MRNNDMLNSYRDTRDIFIREKGKLEDQLNERGYLTPEETELYEYIGLSITQLTERIDAKSRETNRPRKTFWKRIFSK